MEIRISGSRDPVKTPRTQGRPTCLNSSGSATLPTVQQASPEARGRLPAAGLTRIPEFGSWPVTAAEASQDAPAVSKRGATLARMIRVYADLDCGARCITFKSEQPPAPLELVRAFDDEEREAAWVLFHQLGHLFTRTS
jgi:hypothetical protein